MGSLQTWSRISAPDTLSELAALTISEVQKTLKATSTKTSIEQTTEFKLSKIPFNSPSDNQLRTCPKRYPIDHAIDWYSHPTTPSFLICSNCHATHIATTAFAPAFVREFNSEKVKRTCLFHVDRMKKILWPQAITTGNLTEVIQFMDRRSHLKCPGTIKNNDTSIQYYTHKQNEPVEGFVVCAACYEDVVLAKEFADDFQPYPVAQTVENFWACDAAIPPVQRAFENNDVSAAWVEAARLGIKRLGLNPCPGNRAGDTTRAQWYKPIKHIEGFVICETCYFERVVNTPFMGQFEFAAPIWQIGWSCDFSAWSVSFAWDAAILRNDYDMFWKSADKIMHSPFCASEGMESNLWYTVKPGLRDFNVCPACYEGMFRACGCEDHLVPQSFSQEETKPVTCSMWRENPRARMYMLKFCEAVDTLQFSLFSNLVTDICSVPSCPRDSTWTNRYWYGYPDALFCQECYVLFARQTSLAQDGKLQLNFEAVLEARFCSVYSPRMRAKLLEACKSGDVEPFLEFARHRAVVHSQTMPEVRRLLEMMQMRQMMSLAMGYMAMMTNAGDSISNMAGSTSESWSVTTSDGFHGTGGSELGAQRQADFERSMADVSRMDEMTRGTYLERLWKAVE